MTNIAAPDQLTDLDLLCLLRQVMSCLAREGLKIYSYHIFVCNIFILCTIYHNSQNVNDKSAKQTCSRR